MKLRIKGNSIRLRISRSDLALFLETGSLEDTVYFAAESGAAFTYALVLDHSRQAVDVAYAPHRVAVFVPQEAARQWGATEQVGISADIPLGVRGTLSVLIEKDFACIDRDDADNSDTFPNPIGVNCR